MTRGRYQDASEVIGEGLRLVENREVEEATKLRALRSAIHAGLADLDRGAFEEFADAAALAGHLNKLADEIAAGMDSPPSFVQSPHRNVYVNQRPIKEICVAHVDLVRARHYQIPT